jgi:PAS domain S-box-containing protein
MARVADILVVDDDPLVCETLGGVLQERGHRVQTVGKGQMALERLMQRPSVDLAIIDFRLSDASGLDLLRRIKMQAPETEVIFITGGDSPSGAPETIHAAVGSVIVKPLDIEHLVATIDQALARQRRARELRESEERYRLVTGNMTEAVFLLDGDGRVVMGNAYGETLTGYRQEDLRGARVFSLLTPESARRAELRLEALRAGRNVSPRFEVEFVHRDSGRIHAEIHVSRVAKAGRVVSWLAVARDVSPRKRAEQVAGALARLDRDPVDTIDSSSVAQRMVASALQVFEGRRATLYTFDRASGVLVCVATAGEIDSGDWVGWRRPVDVGLAGRAVTERRLVSSSGPASIRIVLPEPTDERLLEEALPGNVAAPLIARGAVAGVLLLGTGRQRTMSDETLRLFGLFADNAARALENAQLLAECERHQTAAERLTGVAGLLSRSLRAVDVAQEIADSVCTILGARIAAVYRLEPESSTLEVVAVTVAPGVPQAPVRRGTMLPSTVGAAGLAVRERRPVTSPDILADPRISVTPKLRQTIEQIGYRAVLAVPLLVQDRVVGALGVGHQAGMVSNDEDIRLVGAFADHAAVALETERLYRDLDGFRASQGRMVAAAALPASETLVAGVTHYFNNVLHTLLGRIHLVLERLDALDGLPAPELRRSLEAGLDTIQDAAGVLRRLQGFSESQTLSDPQPVRLNALVREAVEAIRLHWKGGSDVQGIRISLDTELDRASDVAGERSALLEVLSVLLLNAVDALPAGGGTIAIKTWASERWAHCTIADSGTGMSEDVRSRAIEPFFTTKGSRRKGLGLSVAYGIIRRHRGEIEIASAEGRGTTVTVRLPLEPYRHVVLA